jgi:hypothetical protein
VFDFPNSPTEGAVYAPAGGPQYTFTNGAWRMIGTPSPLVATADPYNRIVNGAMQHSQENGNAPSATTALNTAYYAADQWITRWDLSVGTANGKNFAGITPNNSANYLVFSVVAAVTSLAAASYAITTQLIEGLRVADLGYGTAGAKQLVLRFWVNTSVAGTYSVAIINNASDRSYVAQFTTVGGWEMKTIVIPGDVTGTWAKDSNIGLRLNFVWAVGSTYVGVTGWQAGGKFAGVGQATSLGAGSTYTVADVGLYLDPNNTGLPPPWMTPDYAAELAACQRYWENARSGADGYGVAGTALSYRAYFKQPKRTNPTVSAVSAIVTNASATPTADSATVNTFRIYRTVTATGNAGFSEDWIVNARM